MATTPTRTTDSTERRTLERSKEAARQAADTVAAAAGEVTSHLPEAADSAREALLEANRRVRAGSDESLKIVGAMSLGFAGGLLLGGANRMVVLAALAPAALIGVTLTERWNGSFEGATKVR
ncbi:MAG TPA: hypothetical protein VFJ80_07040 [Candidatus Limnocylindrales bacterium]|nr:hypothetical protein [Candidatus Limnocylindrales bacterium]